DRQILDVQLVDREYRGYGLAHRNSLGRSPNGTAFRAPLRHGQRRGKAYGGASLPVREDKLVKARGGKKLRGQHRIELAGVIERVEVVASADMSLADVDLRHGAPAGA